MRSTPLWIPASLVELIYVAANLLMAYIHYRMILPHMADGKKVIKHGLWGGIFCAGIGAGWYWGGGSWLFWLAQIVGRLPIFNWALDSLQGLPLDHVSTSTTAITDRVIGRLMPFVEALCASLYLLYTIIYVIC